MPKTSTEVDKSILNAVDEQPLFINNSISDGVSQEVNGDADNDECWDDAKEEHQNGTYELPTNIGNRIDVYKMRADNKK